MDVVDASGLVKHFGETKALDGLDPFYTGLPAGDDLWWSLFWIAAITIVFAALAIRRFSRVTS